MHTRRIHGEMQIRRKNRLTNRVEIMEVRKMHLIRREEEVISY
jgi:hypothetical protein